MRALFLLPLLTIVLAACDELSVLDDVGDDDVGDDGAVDVVIAAGVVDDDGSPAAPRCTALPAADDPLEVQTKNATVKGFVADDDVATWKAIRYGKAPVGALRFRPTQPADCEPAVVDAREDPPQCPQLGADFDAVVGDEDCLFLNVFRPPFAEGSRDDESRELLPVLFFIHGGGEILGSGHQPAGVGNLYDGNKLAREANAVVVTINYRLGALGFLAHPSLATEDGAVGNWAHYDVIEALKWVRDNVEGFGGDKDHVAVFGESAGAHNVCVLIASPLAKGLFASAIMESGGCEVAPLDVREAEGADTTAGVGCDEEDDVAACLREKTAEEFLHLVPPIPPLVHVWWLPYGSTVDGAVLTDQPLHIIERGLHNKVPFIAGSNREETNLFLAADGALTCFDLRVQLDLLLDGSFATDDEKQSVLDEAMQVYECDENFIVRDVLIEASTDLEFTCHARRVARAMDRAQDAPVWRYHFADRANVGAFFAMGAFHAWELFYVFDAFETGLYLPSNGERDLAHLVQRMWGRMARDGNPNGGGPNGSGDPTWPEYEAGVDSVFEFDEDPFAEFGGAVDVNVVDDPAPECDLWDRYAL